MDQQFQLSETAAVPPAPSALGLNDQSCNECRRRKGRCDRQLPECGPCARNKRHCLYERHSKTPLTRKYLTSVEERLRHAEMRARQMERRAQLAEARLQQKALHPPTTTVGEARIGEVPPSAADEFTAQFGEPAEPSASSQAKQRQKEFSASAEVMDTGGFRPLSDASNVWQYVDDELDTHQQIMASPTMQNMAHRETGVRASELEAPPSDADDFSWDEQSSGERPEYSQIPSSTDRNEESNLTDGMASLDLADGGSGYLGVASGAAMLRLLLPDAEHRRPTKHSTHAHHRTTSTAESDLLMDHGYVPTPVYEERRIGEIDLDAAINSYFGLYHLSYPIVHEPTFRAQYSQVIPRPSGKSWRALAYMLGAIGLFTASTGHVTRDLDLFEAAKANISIGSLESGNLTLVQVIVLMSNYLQKRNKPNSGYNYLGLALHMAMGLGLHKEFQNWRIAPLAMEIRRRVWWCLQVFAVGAMVTFGRPLSWPSYGIEVALPLNVDDRDLTNVSTSLPPAKTGMTTYTAVASQARFHLATNDIYSKVISVNFPNANELLQLDEQRIEAWRLLWHPDQEEVPLRFCLSRSIMEWRYRNFRIIMYRPFVIRHVLQQRSGQDVGGLSSATWEAINRCLHEAKTTISSIQSYWSSYEHNRMAAWYALYFLFQASLIPCMSLRNNPMAEQASDWRDQIHTVLGILDSMVTVNPASKECRLVIVRLCGDFLQHATDSGREMDPYALHPVEESPQTQLSGVYSMMWPSAASTADVDLFMNDSSWTNFLAETQTTSPFIPEEFSADLP